MKYPVCPLAFILLLSLPPAASPADSNEDCLACHSDKSLSTQRGAVAISLHVDGKKYGDSVHSGLSCVDCHQGFKASEMPHAKVIRPVDCQTCHEVASYAKSVHGKPKEPPKPGKKLVVAASCKDCHGYHAILAKGDPKSKTNGKHISETCGKCHEEVERHFLRSAHGIAAENDVKGAPSCVDCHGEHDVEPTSSRESPIYRTKEEKVCLKCHLDNPDVRNRVVMSAGFIRSYDSSVHGVALAKGNQRAATCSSCHGAHDMMKGNNPTSKVNKWNIPQTCGQCHSEISKTFNESIHGVSLQWGNKDAPACTDCHGEHQILGPGDARARVSPNNVASEVCATCHGSVRLSQKFGMSTERYKTFNDSFHGLASRGGVSAVANCASCHGVHNIKPSHDPTSTISKANLAATCGKCHPGAGENFTKGTVHVAEERDSNKYLFWIRTFYLWIIGVTIGGMLVHNGLDFARKSAAQFAFRTGRVPRRRHGTELFERMCLSERIQHALTLTSFITLVVTGFMLRFPDAWWVQLIRGVSEQAFEIRSLLHRAAGVVMIGVSLYHVGYLRFAARGRQLMSDMLPRLEDAKDVVAQLAWYTGLSKKKPRFGRFCYIEKAEYWALIWGVTVMAGTGIVMWFDNFFINRITKLGWDIARTIHYYEAILATLAIIVWHFYFVMFNPNIYPMNTAWITGKITEEEMEDEHPLELEKFRAEHPREAEDEE